MKYRVWLSFSNPTDPGSVAVRRLLQTLTGVPVVDFLPIQEKCVGTVELASPPDWTDDQIMAVLRPLSPNAVGVRFEPMADVAVMSMEDMMEAVEMLKLRHDIVSGKSPLTPEVIDLFNRTEPAPDDAEYPDEDDLTDEAWTSSFYEACDKPERDLPSGQGTPEYDAAAPLLDTLKSVPQVFQVTPALDPEELDEQNRIEMLIEEQAIEDQQRSVEEGSP